MAMLATFDEAGVLPPESSPQANQLIRALIQFQSAFLKSSEAAVREFLASALQVHGHQRARAILDRFALTGVTSESLEAWWIIPCTIPCGIIHSGAVRFKLTI